MVLQELSAVNTSEIDGVVKQYARIEPDPQNLRG